MSSRIGSRSGPLSYIVPTSPIEGLRTVSQVVGNCRILIRTVLVPESRKHAAKMSKLPKIFPNEMIRPFDTTRVCSNIHGLPFWKWNSGTGMI